MIDPERAEAAEAVRVAKEAGVRPIMITGDHKENNVQLSEQILHQTFRLIAHQLEQMHHHLFR
jgi:cation transport ATPase